MLKTNRAQYFSLKIKELAVSLKGEFTAPYKDEKDIKFLRLKYTFSDSNEAIKSSVYFTTPFPLIIFFLYSMQILIDYLQRIFLFLFFSFVRFTVFAV